MSINAKTKINMIIGDPIEHSLSPQMHNSAYKALDIAGQFAYLAARVKPENLKNAIQGIRALNINGVTITVPHKTSVIKFVDALDETARKIGAVNTIVNDKGKLKGYNTDFTGVIDSIENVSSLKNKKVAVIGAGGLARAVIFACKKKGAKVKIYNRTLNRAKLLADKFGCDFESVDKLDNISNADIVINATIIGLVTNVSPLPKEVIKKNQIVFDCVYTPFETKLLIDAKKNGAKTIHGTELLLNQGVKQFELFTGKKAPREAMRMAIMSEIE